MNTFGKNLEINWFSKITYFCWLPIAGFDS